MINCNVVRVITFISLFLLFFTVPVYDPSVYAKMQAMDEDSLSKIDGQEGITLGLDLTVRSVANYITFDNGLTGASRDSINFGYASTSYNSVVIGGPNNTAFDVTTNLTIDVGSNTTDNIPWLLISGIVLPSNPEGIYISADNINITDNGVDRTLGNLAITGLYLGQSVATSQMTGSNLIAYTAGNVPWIRLTGKSAGEGIEFFGEMGAYIDHLNFTYNSTPTALKLSGIYIFGANATNIADGDPANWHDLTGNAIIGNATTPASLNVGTNTTTGATALGIDLPGSMSIRVRDFQIDPAKSFGPLAIDNLTVYRGLITIRSL